MAPSPFLEPTRVFQVIRGNAFDLILREIGTNGPDPFAGHARNETARFDHGISIFQLYQKTATPFGAAETIEG
jgi:hypothetical protein